MPRTQPTPSISRASAKSLFLELRVREESLATATGFLVAHRSRTFLITNRHVVTGRDNNTNEVMHSSGATPDAMRITYHHVDRPGERVVVEEPLLDDHTGLPLWLEHSTWGARADVVALPLTKTDGVAIEPYDPTYTDPDLQLYVTEPVSIVGFPFGRSGAAGLAIWSRGTIASEPGLDWEEMPRFLVDCRARTGQSGSPVVHFRPDEPVVDYNGHVHRRPKPVEILLGVYSGRIAAESDIGIVWRASIVQDIITDGSPPGAP